MLASAEETTRTWIPDQWAQLFPVVQGQYLGSDLQYHDCEFRYYGNAAPITLEDTIASGDVSMLGRNCVNYRAYLPDSNIPIQAFYDGSALYDAKFIMDFDFTFIDCSYVSMGFFGYIYPTSQMDAYYSAQSLLFDNADSNQWNYDVSAAIESATNATGGMRGFTWSGNRFNGLGGIATISQAPGNLHFGTLSIAAVGSNTASDGSFFGVVLPVANSDAQIVLGNPDDDDDDGENVVTGTAIGTGIIITDDSGVTRFDFHITNEFQAPGYLQTGDFDDYTDDYMSSVSGLVSDFGSYGTAAASDIAAVDDYDLSGYWDFFDTVIPPRIVIAIMAVSWLSLFGWILTKYRG